MIDDLFSEPNGSAIQRTELRTGPPLDYIAEKVQNAIKHIHRAYTEGRSAIPDDLSYPLASNGLASPISIKEDLILGPIEDAFRKSVVAYLALLNLLALANDHALFGRLLRSSPEQLRQWLNRITRQGSLLGE